LQNTSGTDNIAVGYSAMGAGITTGSSNVAVGNSALNSNTSGRNNVAVGYNAGKDSPTSSESVYVGYKAGEGNQGVECVGIGYLAHTIASTGSGQPGNYNTCVGWKCGDGLTAGDNNIIIGHDAGHGTVGPYMNAESNRVILGDGSITNFYCYVSLTTGSDARDKAEQTDFSGGLDWVNAMQPITYKWDKRLNYIEGEVTKEAILAVVPDGTHKEDSLEIGLSAQAVLAVEQANGYGSNNDTSLLVDDNEFGNYGMRYERLVPILISAVKELSAKVEALENA
jgi:hypothetical protein